MYKVVATRQAYKDSDKLKRAGLSERRINRQHRFIYEVLPNTENLTDANGVSYKGIVKIIRMWTHYE